MEHNFYFIIDDVNNIYGKKYIGKSGSPLVENPNTMWLNVNGERVLVDKKDVIPAAVYKQTLKTIEDVMKNNNLSQKQAIELLVEAYKEGIRIFELFL
jgi:nitrogenase subunit NifH